VSESEQKRGDRWKKMDERDFDQRDLQPWTGVCGLGQGCSALDRGLWTAVPRYPPSDPARNEVTAKNVGAKMLTPSPVFPKVLTRTPVRQGGCDGLGRRHGSGVSRHLMRVNLS